MIQIIFENFFASVSTKTSRIRDCLTKTGETEFKAACVTPTTNANRFVLYNQFCLDKKL